MTPDIHRSSSLMQLCRVYTASLYMHTLLFGVQLPVPITTKLTYLMTAYYTPNDGFTANNTSFYKNDGGQLKLQTTHHSVFPVTRCMYAIVKTNKKYYHAS